MTAVAAAQVDGTEGPGAVRSGSWPHALAGNHCCVFVLWPTPAFTGLQKNKKKLTHVIKIKINFLTLDVNYPKFCETVCLSPFQSKPCKTICV